jgi:hypothetical protein
MWPAQKSFLEIINQPKNIVFFKNFGTTAHKAQGM